MKRRHVLVGLIKDYFNNSKRNARPDWLNRIQLTSERALQREWNAHYKETDRIARRAQELIRRKPEYYYH